ncbi:MAG: carboxypeptidase regulatory-like domain-containing protein, partial [Anaerolineales bacterium]|nr:carboxypeptidase regulatory-like domain-containing protein [Anaerolineales bacterium]
GADGSWQIDTAVGGLYSLAVDLAGFSLTTEPPPPIPLPAQGATLVNFGLNQPPPAGLGKLTGRAFADLNGNGSADPGESGLAGVTINLLQGSSTINTTATDANGFYQFNAVTPGIYQLRATAPANYYPAQFTTADVSLAAGQVAGVPFGFAGAGSIGGTISSGGGYPVAGATVILLDENEAGIATAATNGSGAYSFPSVAPGNYFLRLLPPPEYLFADGQDTRPITLPGFGAVTEDWTLLRQGRLRIRTNLQGVIPFVPVGNVRFVISPTTGLTTTVRTDANGEAIVDGLAPGLYTIRPFFGPDPSEATVAPAQRQVNIGLDSSALADFTISFPRSIRYRCERWVNGTVPHGPPFACIVNLTALQVNGVPAGTQVAQGQLAGERVGLFTEVVSGTYRVTITPDPAVTGQAGWPVYEEIVSLGDGDHREVAYQYNPVGGAVMIWGYAFYDRNQDGHRQIAWNEASDSAANGLTVSLFRLDGTLVMTTTTQPQAQYGPGYYSFPDLAPDSYRVEIALGVGQYPTTPQNIERLVNAISPPEPVHFGYIKQFDATVQGQAFYDNNGDGLFNPASDDPISGATLELADSDGNLINTTASAADGSYSFGGLVTGVYEVTLLPPGDAGQLTRSVAVPAGNSAVTLNYALAPADGRTRALVYLDGNFNGLPDDGEAMAGATVLRRHAACQSLGNAQVDSAVSDASGLALFNLIATGPFCLAADPDGLPPGAVPAQHNGVALARGQGLVWIRLVPAGTLNVLPFWDMDGDFVQDSFEPIVGGADVTIPGEGTIRSSATTGATFSLSTGSYAVTVAPPANMSVTIIQPQTASLSNGSATSLAIPLRYLGQIQGTVNANGGTPPWSNVTVVLDNLSGGGSATRSVPIASGYFSFQNLPTGSYRLRLQNNPPGWILAHEPVFFYTAGASVAQSLTLIQLESISGLVYTDANG